MHENEQVVINGGSDSIEQASEDKPDGNSPEVTPSPAVPKPVFMRMLLLFGGGVGCLLVGIVVSIVTGDLIMLVMSAILCVAFVTKGVILKRKIATGQIFCVFGVCVSITPKMLGRYKRMELVNVDSGDDVHFVLPKKTVFKVGHVYHCYFDHQISNRLVSIDTSKVGYLSAEFDLPTNGFLGFEDFGVYQEKPAATARAAATETAADNAANSASADSAETTESTQITQNNEEENV